MLLYILKVMPGCNNVLNSSDLKTACADTALNIAIIIEISPNTASTT